MSDKSSAIFAAAISLPLAVLIIYAAFRRLVARLRDLREAISEVRRQGGRQDGSRNLAQAGSRREK